MVDEGNSPDFISNQSQFIVCSEKHIFLDEPVCKSIFSSVRVQLFHAYELHHTKTGDEMLSNVVIPEERLAGTYNAGQKKCNSDL